MMGLLATEWIKIRHRWMPRIIILIMFVIIGLLALGSLGSKDLRSNFLLPQGLLFGLALAGLVSPFLWPILAGAWGGNEYGWGTIRMTLSRRPSRSEQALSGLFTMIAYTTLALIIAIVFTAILGGLLGIGYHVSLFNQVSVRPEFGWNLIKAFIAEMYAVSLYVLIAYAAGTIFRSAAAGIGIGIGSWIAQEIIRGIFVARLGGTWATIAEHFPNSYIAALPERVMNAAVTGNNFNTEANAPGVWQSVAGIAAYMVIITGIMLIVVNRRDVSA